MAAAGSLTGTELVPIVQSGANKQTTAQDIADLGGGGNIIIADVPINSATYLTIGASTVVLLAAPGANKIIQVLGFWASYKFVTTAYSNVGQVVIKYNNGSGLSVTGSGTFGSGTQDQVWYPGLAAVANAQNSVNFVNQPIILFNGTGNPATGDGTFIFHITYRILDVS